MSVLGHWRDSMLKMTDEPRWEINGHTMQAEGPWLKNAGRIAVVPEHQLREAVGALRALHRTDPARTLQACTEADPSGALSDAVAPPPGGSSR